MGVADSMAMAPAPHPNRDKRVAPRRLGATVLAAAVALGLGGTGQAAKGAAAGTGHPFGPGEMCVYDVHYGPIHTGQARILVGSGEAIAGQDVWPIVVQAQTNDVFSHVFLVHDEFVTLWSPKAAASVGFDFHADENGRRRFTRARLDPVKGRAIVERQVPGGRLRRKDYRIGPTAHDIASAMFWLRTRPLTVGDREQVRVFTGHRTWTLVARVEGRETITTPAGRYRTVRVRIRTHFHGKLAARRDIVLWMTDDPSHIPVRIEAPLVLGSLRADLARYLPGVSQ